MVTKPSASPKKTAKRKRGARQPKALLWNSGTHSISDLRDWATALLLEIRPDFQRREVWSEAAKIALIDTVIRNIPMPKLYVHAEVRDQKTFRAVIDGQQRMTSILDFLSDKLVLSSSVPVGFQNKKFSELAPTQQAKILYYKIDVNEVISATDEQVRELYSRVNKYTKQLTKQELRRADFPGDFLDTSEQLATTPYLEQSQLFGSADLKRMGDVEFVSELLAGLLGGIQDKKANLDDFYERFGKWPKASHKKITASFEKVLGDIAKVFPETFPIWKVRFKQKADFYGVFFAIAELQAEGLTLAKDTAPLRADLAILDAEIAPTSPLSLFSAYAVRCVSDANSSSSRRWRTSVLKAFIGGSYRKGPPSGDELTFVASVHADIMNGEPDGPAVEWACPICGKASEGFFFDSNTVGWEKSARVFQLSNLSTLHVTCAKKAPKAAWALPADIKLTKPPVWLEE